MPTTRDGGVPATMTTAGRAVASRAGRDAPAVSVLVGGLLAGAAGVAAMTLAEKVEQALTGRPNSYVPAHTLERLLRLPARPDRDRLGLNWAMHWGQGIVLGPVRAWMAKRGFGGPFGSFLFLNLRLLNDQSLENAAGVGAPPWTWPRDEQAIDIAHKAVYAFVAGAVADLLMDDPDAGGRTKDGHYYRRGRGRAAPARRPAPSGLHLVHDQAPRRRRARGPEPAQRLAHAAGAVLLAVGQRGRREVERVAGPGLVGRRAVGDVQRPHRRAPGAGGGPVPPYRRGLLRLVPPARRARAAEVLDALGGGLWHWILGQSAAMLCVGVVAAAGLALLGVPLALALGILAGLLNFIPHLGPVLSGGPTVLIAFAQSPADALNTLLFFVAIQNLEGYVLTPLLQRRSVSIPPALGVLAIVGLGALSGTYGVLFATPLLLVLMVLVRMLYVEDALADRAADPP